SCFRLRIHFGSQGSLASGTGVSAAAFAEGPAEKPTFFTAHLLKPASGAIKGAQGKGRRGRQRRPAGRTPHSQPSVKHYKTGLRGPTASVATLWRPSPGTGGGPVFHCNT